VSSFAGDVTVEAEYSRKGGGTSADPWRGANTLGEVWKKPGATKEMQ